MRYQLNLWFVLPPSVLPSQETKAKINFRGKKKVYNLRSWRQAWVIYLGTQHTLLLDSFPVKTFHICSVR